MVRSINCIDELKRANSAPVNRNSMGLEPLLPKMRFLVVFDSVERDRLSFV